MKNIVLYSILFMFSNAAYAQDCVKIKVRLYCTTKFQSSYPKIQEILKGYYVDVARILNRPDLDADFVFEVEPENIVDESWTTNTDATKLIVDFSTYIKNQSKDITDVCVFVKDASDPILGTTFIGNNPCTNSPLGIQLMSFKNSKALEVLGLARFFLRNLKIATDSIPGYLMSTNNTTENLSPTSIQSINSYLKGMKSCYNTSKDCLISTGDKNYELSSQIEIQNQTIINPDAEWIEIMDLQGRILLATKSISIDLNDYTGFFIIKSNGKVLRKIFIP
ncbi:MAG: hypothetical protein WBB17_15725 [Saprospiraceae bacterium]